MAKRASYAHERISVDHQLVFMLVATLVATLVLVVAAWPDGPERAAWWVPGLILLASGVIVTALARRIQRRFKDGGGHWYDRWVTTQGELLEQVLAGRRSSAEAQSGQVAAQLGKAGIVATVRGASALNNPLAHFVVLPLAASGLSLMATGAAISTAQGIGQRKRDLEVTKLYRGAAHQMLCWQLADLEQEHRAAHGRHRRRSHAS